MALVMTMLTKTQADYRKMNPWLQFVVTPPHQMALIMTMITKTQDDYMQMNPWLEFVVRPVHQMDHTGFRQGEGGGQKLYEDTH